MKRKNLQCFSNLEPCPKRIKNYNTILKNTLKRKISYSDMSNISTFSLSQSIIFSALDDKFDIEILDVSINVQFDISLES